MTLRLKNREITFNGVDVFTVYCDACEFEISFAANTLPVTPFTTMMEALIKGHNADCGGGK